MKSEDQTQENSEPTLLKNGNSPKGTKQPRKKIDKSKMRMKTYLLTCFAIYFFFRLFALAYSFLRKLEEWGYTEDYQTMNLYITYIWIGLILVPLFLTLLVARFLRKIERKFDIHTNEANKQVYVNRLLPITIETALMTIILSTIHYSREHTFMDYISRSFGTITGLGYDFLDWGVFNFIMTGIFLGFAVSICLYLFKGFNREKYQHFAVTLLFYSIIILVIMELLSLRLFYWINTFTISTWFA
jgi:hypothetical protein